MGNDSESYVNDTPQSRIGTLLGEVVERLSGQSGIIPSGTKNITENGTYDVTYYAKANVDVRGSTPSGTTQITENGTYDVSGYASAEVNVPSVSPTGSIDITSDGTYDVSDYATANVNTKPSKGLVFGDYDSDGYPHSAEFVGLSSITKGYCANMFLQRTDAYTGSNNYNAFASYVTSIIIPYGVERISGNAFLNCNTIEIVEFPTSLQYLVGRSIFQGCSKLESVDFKNNIEFFTNANDSQAQFASCNSLKRVSFAGSVDRITQSCFLNCSNIMLYDFSKCISIPPLYNTNSLGHKSGCVIKIPQSLSDTTLGEGNGWESATNWAALTDIVWEVV